MNYAFDVEICKSDKLLITPRKRTLKYSLVYVASGLVLIRLGKIEYAVEPHQAWWIPFDCLSSLTFLPNSVSVKIDFSVRLLQAIPHSTALKKSIVKDRMSHQAGQVELSLLAQEAIKRLTITKRGSPLYEPLSSILKHEASLWQPKLIESPLSQVVSRWDVNKPSKGKSQLSADLQLALQIREARKLELSGKRSEEIAHDLFQGNLEQYLQLKQILLG
jgi:hypothetical protein